MPGSSWVARISEVDKMVTRTLAELAAELGGQVVGDGSTVVRGVAGIREAQAGDITFLANARYAAYLHETRASAVLCNREPRSAPDAAAAGGQSLPGVPEGGAHLPPRDLPASSPACTRPPWCRRRPTLGRDVSIGPNCVIERGARLGDRGGADGGLLPRAPGVAGRRHAALSARHRTRGVRGGLALHPARRRGDRARTASASRSTPARITRCRRSETW